MALNPDELVNRAEAERERVSSFRERLHVCTAASCQAFGSDQLKASMQARAKTGQSVEVAGTGCMGLCSKGPLVKRESDGALFLEVTPDDVPGLVDGALSPSLEGRRVSLETHPFFARQTADRAGEQRARSIPSGSSRLHRRRRLRGAGQGRCTEMTPAEVVERGHAQRPARPRRRRLPDRPQVGHGGQARRRTRKYVICNGDEGDPGAFMDRSVLEGDPHRVLEGMAIAAYAVGAEQGYIYVRGEYPLAIRRLETAIKQAERARLLGSRHLRHRRSTSGSTSGSAPAPSSAARRRR